VAYRAPEKSVARVAQGAGGHYFTPGRINRRPVNFLVDTGATAVAMNSKVAEGLGIDFRKGRVISVSTAAGITSAYEVLLDSVSVGGVEVSNVKALVQEGHFPQEILLGNSYLQRVDVKIERGVLVLQSRI
jgi:aspartyl protease family protein